MLDPQAKALLDLIVEKGIPPTHTVPPLEARAAYVTRRFFTQPDPPAVALAEDKEIPGPRGLIKIRHYRPAESLRVTVLPCLMYYHGGGHVIGDLDTHDVLCRQLANAATCSVVSVDYRMAPEYQLPAASDDCVSATQWVHANAKDLNIDPFRIAVGGDSAGGHLAAVVALSLREAKGFKPILQLLIYPVTDAHGSTQSMITNGQGYMLTVDTMKYFFDLYMPDKESRKDWRASPLLATSHADLPAAFVLTAGYDPLRDEGRAYADKLSAAGVPTQYVCFERQIHGFILMGRVLREANTAVKLCAQVLRDSFYP